MTIAFSSSSPIASVALFDEDESLICERSQESRQNASAKEKRVLNKGRI